MTCSVPYMSVTLELSLKVKLKLLRWYETVSWRVESPRLRLVPPLQACLAYEAEADAKVTRPPIDRFSHTMS